MKFLYLNVLGTFIGRQVPMFLGRYLCSQTFIGRYLCSWTFIAWKVPMFLDIYWQVAIYLCSLLQVGYLCSWTFLGRQLPMFLDIYWQVGTYVLGHLLVGYLCCRTFVCRYLCSLFQVGTFVLGTFIGKRRRTISRYVPMSLIFPCSCYLPMQEHIRTGDQSKSMLPRTNQNRVEFPASTKNSNRHCADCVNANVA